MMADIKLRTWAGASSHGAAAGPPDSRALQYPAGLINYQPQPGLVMQKCQTKPPSVFPDALLASGGKTSAAHCSSTCSGSSPRSRDPRFARTYWPCPHRLAA